MKTLSSVIISYKTYLQIFHSVIQTANLMQHLDSQILQRESQAKENVFFQLGCYAYHTCNDVDV